MEIMKKLPVQPRFEIGEEVEILNSNCNFVDMPNQHGIVMGTHKDGYVVQINSPNKDLIYVEAIHMKRINKPKEHKDLPNPESVTLNDIAVLVHDNAKAHGFHEEPIETWWPKMLLNSITEITEVWDADRMGNLHVLCDKSQKMIELGLAPLTNLEEEYADRIIRALDESKRMGITNIAMCVLIKHAYNVTRPYKHGKKN